MLQKGFIAGLILFLSFPNLLPNVFKNGIESAALKASLVALPQYEQAAFREIRNDHAQKQKKVNISPLNH